VPTRSRGSERHHAEVISAAATGDAVRAAGQLREHLANVGCDPLAHRVAAYLRQGTWATTDRLPNCHPTTWEY
jgi:DNA-binding GntR family transcriptional regulator